jgi:hypothetical protein
MTTTIISSTKPNVASNDRGIEIAKSVYQADHQSKFFTLQAEAESLLQQLQSIKQQRGLVDHSHN